jgi:hypothetical protein
VDSGVWCRCIRIGTNRAYKWFNRIFTDIWIGINRAYMWFNRIFTEILMCGTISVSSWYVSASIPGELVFWGIHVILVPTMHSPLQRPFAGPHYWQIACWRKQFITKLIWIDVLDLLWQTQLWHSSLIWVTCDLSPHNFPLLSLGPVKCVGLE